MPDPASPSSQRVSLPRESGEGRSDVDPAQRELEVLRRRLGEETAARHRAEAALREHEAQLAVAHRLARVGRWRWDVAENDVSWSEETYRIFGMPDGEAMTYARYLACIHPDDRARLQQAMRAALGTREPYDLYHRIVRPDLTIRIVHGWGEPVLDEAGAVIALQGTVQDVTEQRLAAETLQQYAHDLERSEREVRAANDFLQGTLDALTAHIAILDERFDVVAVNEAWRQFGRENGLDLPDGGVGTNYLASCLHAGAPVDEDAARVADGLRTVLAAEKDSFSMEYPCHSETEERWFLLGITRFAGGEGGPRLVVAHEDVTALKHSERRLRHYTRELEERNAELEQFAYVASHDLQEPLRMVESFLQLLQRRYEGRLDERADEYIGYAVRGAQRMRQLIQDLLTYSRVGTRGRPFIPVRMEAVADTLRAELDGTLQAAGATVEVGPLPTVQADPTQMRQLLQHLIDNALKFKRSDPPAIRLSAEREDALPGWRFALADNGIGIDQKYADRVFQIFQRLHPPDEYPGTGIGLAVSKKIVERHGGRIWFEGTPGHGTTFYFTLPDSPLTQT